MKEFLFYLFIVACFIVGGLGLEEIAKKAMKATKEEWARIKEIATLCLYIAAGAVMVAITIWILK